MLSKRIVVGLGVTAIAIAGFATWSFAGAYIAHVFTNG